MLVKQLGIAVEKNDTEKVQSILTENPEIFHAGGLQKCVQLFRATGLGRTEIIDLFINFGLDINERYIRIDENDVKSFTILHCLASLEDDDWINCEKGAKILIRHGADVNAYCYPTLRTPIQLAIEHKLVHYTEFLLRNGADFIEHPEWSENFLISYILSFVPKTKQSELLRLFIKSGLKVANKIIEGGDYLQTILIIVRLLAQDNIDQSKIIDLVGIARVLLDYGVPVDSFDKASGVSTLVYAVYTQNIELISLLIGRGASVTQRCDFHGFFPLYAGTQTDNLDLIYFLWSKGADLNAKTDFGSTALHATCGSRQENAIKFLIQKGADITVENQMGVTPFALLEPQDYEESDIPCINIMIREIAKLKFFDNSAVNKNDMDLIRSNPVLEKYFQSCIEELDQMSSLKFYASFSMCSVLRMSKNIKKLANLSKNEELVAKFYSNLNKFSYYENDLLRIMKEAIQVRDESITVESRLEILFADFFPRIIVRKLADNLSPKDLPLQPLDTWKCDRRLYI